MKSNCQKSCATCPPALWEGLQVTATVRNAWEANELEGRFIGFYTAKHVERHEARLIRVTFGDDGDAVLTDGLKKVRPYLKQVHAEASPAQSKTSAASAAAGELTLGGCVSHFGPSMAGYAVVMAAVVGLCTHACRHALGSGRRRRSMQPASWGVKRAV